MILDIFDTFQRLDDYTSEDVQKYSRKIRGLLVSAKKVLVQVLHAVYACPLDKDSRPAVEATLDLLAAVGYDNSALLQQAMEGTQVSSENVRLVSCQFLGKCIPHYLVKSNDDDHKNGTQILDQISQNLLPRFTDKLQSVRKEAIVAASKLLQDTDMDDPDVREALVWSIQHDPSIANRETAMQLLPLTPQTLDVCLSRVRDVHLKLRVAALQALQGYTQWTVEDRSALLQAGNTQRCYSTYQAMARLICCSWCKEFQYQPLLLLREMNALLYEEPDMAETMVHILLQATEGDESAVFLQDLSEPEIRAFRQGIQDAALELHEHSQTISVEQAFWARCLVSMDTKKGLGHSSNRQFRSAPPSFLADAPLFCECVERHTLLLIQSIEKEDNEEQVDELCFVCNQLLLLSKTADLEEGSRRHLAALTQRMLSSILLPDDLVEATLMALQVTSRDLDAFLQTVHDIIQGLLSNNQEESLSEVFSLRTVSIITVVAELMTAKDRKALSTSSNNNSHGEFFVKHIMQTMEEEAKSELVLEAAVASLGKAVTVFVGRSSGMKPYVEEVSKLLQKESSSATEEVRGQALLVMGDWGSLYPGVIPDNFAETLLSLLKETANSSIGLRCIGLEVAAKLLLVGRLQSSSLLARLVVAFFQGEGLDDDDENGDFAVKEVGNPVRLEQYLSVFFPAYCSRGDSYRRAFLGCTYDMLVLVQEKHKQKERPHGSKTWPYSKMLDYVSSTSDLKLQHEANSEDLSTGALLSTIQVARYLENHSNDVNKTTLRVLCKFMSTAPIELEREEERDLKELDELVEELLEVLEDAPSTKSLQSLVDLLDKVDFTPAADEDAEPDAVSPLDAENQAPVVSSKTTLAEESSNRLSSSRKSLGSVNHP